MSRENFRILIVDDERAFVTLLRSILEDEGYHVEGMTDAVAALRTLEQFNPNLVITDLKMPGMDGIRFMEEVKKRNAECDVIMMTAFATVETAVSAMKMGAADYITKPLRDPEQLRITVLRIYERQRLTAENRFLKSDALGDMPPLDIVFAGMEETLGEIREVAPTDATVILSGETGTGKSLVARVIHYLSGRKGTFMEVNCAAIPESLLESELFGHERGAFTGALSRKQGRFEIAQDGTVFLDEVTEMSLSVQAKFLRVLQERTFERLGSLTPIRTNARVIAATNRDLRSMVEERTFREDLYYRLNVFPVHIPPLRERGDHIAAIAQFLLQKLSVRLGKESLTLSGDSLDSVMRYHWPGNIRELENVLERAIIVSKGREIVLPALEIRGTEHEVAPNVLVDLKTMEKAAIEKALRTTKGNRRSAAEILGISVRALQYKIKEYGIDL